MESRVFVAFVSYCLMSSYFFMLVWIYEIVFRPSPPNFRLKALANLSSGGVTVCQICVFMFVSSNCIDGFFFDSCETCILDSSLKTAYNLT